MFVGACGLPESLRPNATNYVARLGSRSHVCWSLRLTGGLAPKRYKLLEACFSSPNSAGAEFSKTGTWRLQLWDFVGFFFIKEPFRQPDLILFVDYVALKLFEEAEKVRASGEYKMIQADFVADFGAVKNSVTDIRKSQARKLFELLQASRRNKTEIDGGAGL